MLGASLSGAMEGKAPSEMSALKPYLGKRAVRNFREGDGDNGIIRSPFSAITLLDRRKLDIALQVFFNCVKFKSVGAAQRKERVHRVTQHDDTSGHGMAISLSNTTSTLA
jgi:hypothetical protein